ncbi:SDR family NAD(P)-dependent oxidoreductase [Trinickia sp. LjRoot230]|uniref:SDR family NAD(P)-dependent oxidoreductase n=1 Tax=Trinickia sp. LjRoot230 TaxID=3342288 RepID=UPI003ECF25AC
MTEYERFDREHGLASIRSWLKSLVAELVADPGTALVELDAATPFGELGLDSFRILKLIKQLEANFGRLPKTLVFEYFNIDLLASYFVDRHREAVSTKFGAVHRIQPGIQPIAVDAPRVVVSSDPAPLAIEASPASILMLEKDLPAFPELHAQIDALCAAHRNEGSVSRGTRSIAPNLFIGGARRGYFHYGRSKNVVIAYAYTGPADYFSEAAAEFHRYCDARQYQLNILTDEVIGQIGDVKFSSTPFGVVQRVRNLQAFSLEGGAMRRLRYQVSKFEKAGICRTVEYRCGSVPDVDRDIARLIDRWCDTKSMVNPLIHIVRDEILTGRIDKQHRLFLTYVDDVLQNAILISRMTAAGYDGYLMDLEFYPPEMPSGGLEYAIVNIISVLASEGCDLLSLGGTYGCRLDAGEGPDADHDVERMLDELRAQKLFNDDGNLQFKNKFRPENRTIYLCRPAGSGCADNVIDIILMIADPARMQTPDNENHTLAAGREPTDASRDPAGPQTWIDGDTRSRTLAAHGFNPLNLPAEQIDFDLKTDSWAQLDTDYVRRAMSRVHAQLDAPVDVDATLRRAFGFAHHLLTDTGRTAEALLCSVWPKRGRVPQNLLFPSGLYAQIDAGFTPCELPHRDALRVAGRTPYKADLDWDALTDEVNRHADNIACVWVELCNNATGGHPVSLDHLRAIKALLTPHRIALVIDATRVLENAHYLIEHDAAHAGKTLWAMAHELLACADVVTGSLAKDFGVDRGGVIATNDHTLISALKERQQCDGGGLDAIGRTLVGQALAARERIAERVARRVQAAARTWDALQAVGVPLVAPAGAHCILIDVKQLPDFAGFAYPVPSFLAWLYARTGIRGGAHSTGMHKDGPLGGMVRLAVPTGLKTAEVDELIARLTCAFDTRCNIPEVVPAGGANDVIGNPHAAYRLVRYHRLASNALVTGDASAAAASASAVPTMDGSTAPSICVPGQADRAIAVVGMAGRYPMADSLAQFWDNLCAGRDCVTEMPAERLALRAHTAFSRAYRGGFIDGIDRFDSLFFNISPREAELLDPQERLFLEVAWEALEDAGYYPELLGANGAAGDVGVFVGAVWAMYQMAGVEAKFAGDDANPNSFLWSIANRVSYWMNLGGPSLSVDTACSSSLTALYLACEAIRRGDCASAIVGGVNLDSHQHKFDVNRAGGALSDDGVCRAFGAGANGYVAGEGVGALFIKPLDDALRDRDHVYGIIKGVALNHGGRTAGYTVPSPQAQGELIAASLTRAGVTPDMIGYVEAHGTGTELGDPIEIAGLCNAFASAQLPAQSCAIGSVKTNIGHLEAAAGIVGVMKVLLQMRHGELVPSLHAQRPNAHIDFADTPFRVQQARTPWRSRRTGEPLYAGVSSFGAGGANAHVVLAQYLPEAEPNAGLNGAQGDGDGEGAQRELAFPLSARNAAQLREMAARLSAHLRRGGVAPRLADVAYTLQNGRKPFDHRLVVVASDLTQLADRLTAFAEGRIDANTLSGQAADAGSLTKLLSRTEAEQFVALISRSGDVRKLAQLWVSGLLCDGRAFVQSGRRTPLPTYPFADRRHWIGRAINTSLTALAQRQSAVVLHPLLDSNESTFERQLFKKTFHSRECFVRDHVVSGLPTLPGTAYLELARKAGELAAARPVRSLRNITWVSPLTVESDGMTDAYIELTPNGETASFEVFSNDAAGERRLHAQGRLVYGNAGGGSQDASHDDDGERVDLAAVRVRCKPLPDAFAASIYPHFDTAGMRYGACFQALREVHSGEGEVLGRIELPLTGDAPQEHFVLHPMLLDAAMQAGIAAQLCSGAREMKVPYSLGEVEILHPLTQRCYSYVTTRASARGAVSHEDVAIVDETGKVLVRIRDALGVPLASLHRQLAPPRVSGDARGMLYYAPAWQPAPLEMATEGGALVLFDVDAQLRDACVRQGRTTALVQPGPRFEAQGGGVYSIDAANPDDYARVFAALRADGWPLERICYAWGKNDAPDAALALEQAFERGVYGFLSLCQACVAIGAPDGAQLVYLYGNASAGPQPHHDAINGFARTLELEHPRLACKVLEIRSRVLDADVTARALLTELDAGAQAARTIRRDATTREIRTLQQLPGLEGLGTDGVPLRHGGVYLITGGAGGLGLLFAEHLARSCRANLVLTGRSVLSRDQEAKLVALRSHAADVLYVQADIAYSDDARRVVDTCREHFGRIDGVLHGAGVLCDSLLRNKTRADISAVCAPKIFGAHHLDVLTAEADLDFFALFSSLAAVGGNIGQCDYAYANHYLDSFAVRREAQRAAGARRGRSVSFNWSLWADGGMKLDAPTERFFRDTLGIEPLSRDAGLAAFDAGLLAAPPQLAVLNGTRALVERALGLTVPSAVRAAAPSGARAPDTLLQAVADQLGRTVVDLLKLEADDLSRDSILLDLGFDSLGLTSFANALNATYKLELNPALFFEYPSINAIADLLVREHGAAMLAVHGAGSATSQPKPATVPLPQVGATGARKPVVARGRRDDEPIAIVGMAGIMPQSDDMHEYWRNLRDGRDLVTEIPRERWIWEAVHGDPVKDVNRSYSRWGGFMREVDKFDPLLFGITPREAAMMDPQQRLFIETVWSAIEDSGQRVSDLAGTRTGLFVGVSSQDYVDVLAEHRCALDGYSAAGNAHSILANRISFLFNLRGPSAPLDTACSSSLVALHRAVESIHSGSSDMAIVGGVHVMLTPAGHISLSAAGMLSRDGKCKTFAQDADGYVRGEGVGAIFIKRLSDAQADGNPICAVIRATAENHGGRVTNLTAPNPAAQAELLIEAYERAQIDPATVGYIECHGTGTRLGDPIEIEALKKAFAELYTRHGKPMPSTPHCGLGSVKTNIGHLEPAAGIAGLLKVLLAIRHRQIPATLHCDSPNPHIDLAGSPFYLTARTARWEASRGPGGVTLPRRAGVSAFGWGGANAHAVIEEYVAPGVTSGVEGEQIVVLSARDGERLRAYAFALAAYLRAQEDDVEEPCDVRDLGDLAYTLQVGRDEMDERLAIVTHSREDLIARLDAFIAGEASDSRWWCARVERGRTVDSDAARPTAGDAFALDELARRWVTGQRIDWRQLHSMPRRRLSVPTYPFARQRYWVSDAQLSAPAAPATPAATVTVLHGAAVGSVLAAPVWEDAAAAMRLAPLQRAAGAHEVVLCGLPHLDAVRVRAQLRAFLPGLSDVDVVQARAPDGSDPAEQYRVAALMSFERLRQRMRAGQDESAVFQIVAAHSGANALFAGLAGLVRSARIEQPKLVVQLVLVDDSCDEATLAQRLRECRAAPREAVFRYEGVRASVARWRETHADASSDTPLALRERGVYLITGGLGALGQLFAADILRQVPRAQLVLTGRAQWAELSDEQRDRLRSLVSTLSVEPSQLTYRALDLERRDAVRDAVAAVVARYGALHGLLHGAGTTSDSLIVNKETETFERVLGPKVTGTFNLDIATREIDLDFFVMFSSVSAALGNIGQADYATANGFMDAYAHMRNALARAGERRGHALSFNWPLWEEGGMRLDANARARLLARTGLLPMRTPTGLFAWRQGLTTQHSQLLVMEGQTERLRHMLSGGGAGAAGSQPAKRAAMGQVGPPADPVAARLRQRVLEDLHAFQMGRG